jgi:hypothetical protein
MKYIAFPIDEIDTVLELCIGEVNRYTDILQAEENNGAVDRPKNIGAQMLKAKWEGKVEVLGDMLRYGKECNELI